MYHYNDTKYNFSVHFGVVGEDGHRVRQVVAQKVCDYVTVGVSWVFLVLLGAMKSMNRKAKQLDQSVLRYKKKNVIDLFVHYKHRHQIGPNGRNVQKRVVVECECERSENVYLQRNRRKTFQKRQRKMEIQEANGRRIYLRPSWHLKLRSRHHEQQESQRHQRLLPLQHLR